MNANPRTEEVARVVAEAVKAKFIARSSSRQLQYIFNGHHYMSHEAFVGCKNVAWRLLDCVMQKPWTDKETLHGRIEAINTFRIQAWHDTPASITQLCIDAGMIEGEGA